MPNEIIGLILSICGMLVRIISYQAKKKPMMIALHGVSVVFFSLSYFFIGGGIGVMMNIFAFVQDIIFFTIGKRRGLPVYLAVTLLCAAYVAAYLVYTLVFFAAEPLNTKLWNLLPIAGAFFGTVALAFSHENTLRVVKLGEVGCWLTYNIHLGIGALGGTLCSVFSILSILLALFRFRKKKQSTTTETFNESVKISDEETK